MGLVFFLMCMTHRVEGWYNGRRVNSCMAEDSAVLKEAANLHIPVF